MNEKHQKLTTISFSEMNRLAEQINSKKPKVSLEQMRQKASELKNESRSKVKKQPYAGARVPRV
ncbi:MAG: hypothetical protein ACTHMI_11590, partial [Mucilaginibacter sp.]